MAKKDVQLLEKATFTGHNGWTKSLFRIKAEGKLWVLGYVSEEELNIRKCRIGEPDWEQNEDTDPVVMFKAGNEGWIEGLRWLAGGDG